MGNVLIADKAISWSKERSRCKGFYERYAIGNVILMAERGKMQDSRGFLEGNKVLGRNEAEQGPRFSRKFYLGVFLVVLSLILGKAATAIFILYLKDTFWRWSAITIYVISWFMLAVGVWWVGKEYSDSLRKYLGYKFYHERMYHHTKKFYDRTRELRSKVRGKLNEETQQ